LETISYLKSKFGARNRKYLESKLAIVTINDITDMERGMVSITFVPKNQNGEPLQNKSEKGDVYYKNIIKFTL
jgi:hypothetical protein